MNIEPNTYYISYVFLPDNLSQQKINKKDFNGNWKKLKVPGLGNVYLIYPFVDPVQGKLPPKQSLNHMPIVDTFTHRPTPSILTQKEQQILGVSEYGRFIYLVY